MEHSGLVSLVPTAVVLVIAVLTRRPVESLVAGALVGFVILHGAGYGVTSITHPVVTAEYLGHQGFGTISGVMVK